MATANKVGMGEDFVRHHFTQALPPILASVIAAAINLTLGELGRFAEELILFMNRDMIENTTSECYRRQTRHTVNPKTETHNGVHSFYENQKLQVCHGKEFWKRIQNMQTIVPVAK